MRSQVRILYRPLLAAFSLGRNSRRSNAKGSPDAVAASEEPFILRAAAADTIGISVGLRKRKTPPAVGTSRRPERKPPDSTRSGFSMDLGRLPSAFLDYRGNRSSAEQSRTSDSSRAIWKYIRFAAC